MKCPHKNLKEQQQCPGYVMTTAFRGCICVFDNGRECENKKFDTEDKEEK